MIIIQKIIDSRKSCIPYIISSFRITWTFILHIGKIILIDTRKGKKKTTRYLIIKKYRRANGL